MTKTEMKGISTTLMNEYAKTAVRKKYRGTKTSIANKEGFAWKSLSQQAWCFLPLGAEFNLDNIIRVNPRNLVNI